MGSECPSVSLRSFIVQAFPYSHRFSTKTLVNGGQVCSSDSAVKRNSGLQIPVEFSGSYLPPLRVASETGTHGWSLWLLFNNFDFRVSTYSIPLALPSGPHSRLAHFWVSCFPWEGLGEWAVLPWTHLIIHLYHNINLPFYKWQHQVWDFPTPTPQDTRESVYQPRHF